MATKTITNHYSLRLSTVVLLTIALFDLVTTIMWLNAGQREGNPLFAYVAEHGNLALAAAKMIYLVIPIVILEYARSKKPLTAELGTWIAAGAYAYLYVGHLLTLHHPHG